MDSALEYIAGQNTFDYTSHDPKRDLSLKEYIFMVGFTQVARHSYPNDLIEVACDKLQAALAEGVVLQSSIPTAVTPSRPKVGRVLAEMPCGTCGGGRVR